MNEQNNKQNKKHRRQIIAKQNEIEKKTRQDMKFVFLLETIIICISFVVHIFN